MPSEIITSFPYIHSVHTLAFSGTADSLDVPQPADIDRAPNLETPRQLQSGARNLPQRRRITADRVPKTSRSATTVIASIWKTVYGPVTIDPTATFCDDDANLLSVDCRDVMSRDGFARISTACLRATTLSKSARALEVVLQAHWIDCYDARIKVIAEANPRLSSTEARMAALNEACTNLSWTQKELRNRMAIWRGYQEIKNAGGWTSLVFSGAGIYSTCKYRIGFDDGLLQRLEKIQPWLEVAADTLHPTWRCLLTPVGGYTQPKYSGHHHDWVIDGKHDPIPLSKTYQQWDPDFTFQHLDQCVLDDFWNGQDPRRLDTAEIFTCLDCEHRQSEDPQINQCACFPTLSSFASRTPAPVQVARCPGGKNNGLFARCAFERGMAVGEFVGLVTRGIEGVDVMMGGRADTQYQIYQARMGNYTRFINHSCAPNAQFTKFVFCGIERIMVVSRGIQAGVEITVDYSSSYWNNLDKVCLYQFEVFAMESNVSSSVVQAATRRIPPKRARKETTCYPSESEPENGAGDAKDDETFDLKTGAIRTSKKRKLSATSQRSKSLSKKKIFPFMLLPQEIKNMIYEYALILEPTYFLVASTKGFRQIARLDTTEYWHFKPDGYMKRSPRPSLAISIIALSREIYAQTLAILYGANHFSFKDPRALLTFCATIGSRNCALLQAVVLEDWGRTTFTKTMRFPAFNMLCSAVNLKSLHLACWVYGRNGRCKAHHFLRDAYNWLEAVGIREGRRDAAVELIFLSSQTMNQPRWRTIHKIDNESSTREAFETELRKLLKAKKRD
ncbi:MAG: hypothetical protein Q9169_005972 [Polycauliona sp. 2 TL-2023]